jgi:hypothetical protein
MKILRRESERSWPRIARDAPRIEIDSTTDRTDGTDEDPEKREREILTTDRTDSTDKRI